jgi:hypothetical protein
MLWYIRNKNKVVGPFPTGQIQQEILLGRIAMQAEVSQDKEDWKPLRQFPQLIPETLKGDAADEHTRERLAAARRWADERRRERREAEDDPARKTPGRRSEEGYTTLEYRDHRESVIQTLRPAKERFVLVALVVIALLVGGLYAGVKWVPEQPASPQCEAAGKPGINWRQCNKVGLQLPNSDLSNATLNSVNFDGANLSGSQLTKADLSYADLSNSNLSASNMQQAQLKGASLRAADLRKANLTNADLSYTDLQNAKLIDAVYTNANFSHAIWVDGRKCMAGSVGGCRFANN